MKALWRYLQKQAWPRRWDIVCQVQAIAAVGAAAVIVVAGDRLGLGACLTGLTVALTLPDRSFAHYLAATKREDKPDANAYHDLIFVFSWTAIAHWTVIALALVTFIGLGARDVPIFAGDCSVGGALVVLLIAVLVYAMAQFLVTIITLAQVAEVYISWIVRPGNNAGDDGPKPAP
jgi:hypothetical protein